MIQSTVTDKGQTTVPREVREALGIKPRQRLQWDIEGDGTVTVRPEPSALPLFGSLKTRKKFPGNKAEKAAVRKQISAHAACSLRGRLPRGQRRCLQRARLFFR